MTLGPMEEAGRSGALALALAAAGETAARARRRRIRLQSQYYDRQRHLPGLIALPPELRTLAEPALTRAIIRRLRQALRFSLAHRAAREWTWCRHRHEALLTALAGELLRLRRLN